MIIFPTSTWNFNRYHHFKDLTIFFSRHSDLVAKGDNVILFYHYWPLCQVGAVSHTTLVTGFVELNLRLFPVWKPVICLVIIRALKGFMAWMLNHCLALYDELFYLPSISFHFMSYCMSPHWERNSNSSQQGVQSALLSPHAPAQLGRCWPKSHRRAEKVGRKGWHIVQESYQGATGQRCSNLLFMLTG